MDNLEEDLTCCVCYSLFSDPRVLPCSHTFCKTCLDNLLRVSNNYSPRRPHCFPLKCPNCRSVVELPLMGVEGLPSNMSLRAIVEKYLSNSELRPPCCVEHHRQPLNMYCIQDRQLICGLCLTVGQHQGHPIDDLQSAFIREKQTPSRLLAKLSESKWAQVCELGEQLGEKKARCEALLRQDQQDVNQYFQKLEAMLAKKRHAYLEALDEAGAEVRRVYDPLIHRVKELQEERLDLVSLGSLVEEEDSPLAFLEKVHLFKGRVEEFTNTDMTPLPSLINLSVTPRAADFLQQHWPSVNIGSLEDAPVPKVCCCARCGSVGENEAGGVPTNFWFKHLRTTTSVVLLGLLLLLALSWVNPFGVASHGFSLLSQFSHTTIAFVCDTVVLADKKIEAVLLRWSSYIWSVSEKGVQHVVLLFKTQMTP